MPGREQVINRSHFQNYVFILCLLIGLQMEGQVLAKSEDSNSTTLPAPQASNFGVHEWFEMYDQIRRDAEMTLGEKLHARGALQKRLNSKNETENKSDALTARIIAKYTAAVSALQKLQVLQETSQLQDGYTEYFTKMRQLFVDNSGAESTSATKQSLALAVKQLQELDRKNKKLDDELRKKYGIPKHKHSWASHYWVRDATK